MSAAVPDPKPLTDAELERIKAFVDGGKGMTIVSASRLIATIKRERELLRRIRDTEWNEYKNELKRHLLEVGEE